MIVENQRHTTDIVAAYVRHNSIATDQISGLIKCCAFDTERSW